MRRPGRRAPRAGPPRRPLAGATPPSSLAAATADGARPGARDRAAGAAARRAVRRPRRRDPRRAARLAAPACTSDAGDDDRASRTTRTRPSSSPTRSWWSTGAGSSRPARRPTSTTAPRRRSSCPSSAASTRLDGGVAPLARHRAAARDGAGRPGRASVSRVTPLPTHVRVDVEVPDQADPVVVHLPRSDAWARHGDPRAARAAAAPPARLSSGDPSPGTRRTLGSGLARPVVREGIRPAARPCAGARRRHDHDRTRPRLLVAHPSAELYGSDRVLRESVGALLEAGWDVTVVLAGDGPLRQQLEDDGASVLVQPVPVLRKSLLSPVGVLRFAGENLAAAPRLLRLLRATRPDAVYVSTVTVPLWLLLARLRRRPVVCHVHEAEEQVPRPCGWPSRSRCCWRAWCSPTRRSPASSSCVTCRCCGGGPRCSTTASRVRTVDAAAPDARRSRAARARREDLTAQGDRRGRHGSGPAAIARRRRRAHARRRRVHRLRVVRRRGPRTRPCGGRGGAGALGGRAARRLGAARRRRRRARRRHASSPSATRPSRPCSRAGRSSSGTPRGCARSSNRASTASVLLRATRTPSRTPSSACSPTGPRR